MRSVDSKIDSQKGRSEGLASKLSMGMRKDLKVRSGCIETSTVGHWLRETCWKVWLCLWIGCER